MITTCRSIVLQRIPYSESTFISRQITEEHGICAFYHPGARSRKARYKAAFFLPLQALEVTADFQRSDRMLTPREMHIAHPRKTLYTNPIKNCIAFFLAEVILKAVPEGASDPVLFRFLAAAVDRLDDISGEELATFPLHFLLDLTHHLGFYPHDSEGTYLHLTEGRFVSEPHGYETETAETSALWKRFLADPVRDEQPHGFHKNERAALLESLHRYYEAHVEGWGTLKSLEIVRDVLH